FVGSPDIHMDRNGERTRVSAPLVSGEFFQTMGVRAALGRLLQPSDDLAIAPPVAVLDYGYWQTEFGGDRSIVGKTIDLDNIPVTVVGVAEPNFGQLVPGQGWDMWLPLDLFSRSEEHTSELQSPCNLVCRLLLEKKKKKKKKNKIKDKKYKNNKQTHIHPTNLLKHQSTTNN